MNGFKFGFQAAFGLLAAVLVVLAAWWAAWLLFGVWVAGGGDALKVVVFWGWVGLSIVCGGAYWLFTSMRTRRVTRSPSARVATWRRRS